MGSSEFLIRPIYTFDKIFCYIFLKMENARMSILCPRKLSYLP